MSKYELTEEHRAQLPEFAEYGIRLALRTEAQTDADRERFRAGALEAAQLARLPEPRVVFTTSAIAARFAAGFADVMLTTGVKPGAPVVPGRMADAVRRATLDAVGLPYTGSAEGTPTHTLDRWYTGVDDMRALADELGVGKDGLQRAFEAHAIQEGGNMWAGPVARQEFFRQVAKLPIDWAPWMPWLAMAETGGFRYVHEKFVIVSDFPEVIHQDSANRPHCETGPYLRWRDGVCLYNWRGVRIPAWFIEDRGRISLDTIKADTNAETRRIQVELYGMTRFIEEGGGRLIDESIDEGGQPMRLYDVDGIRRLRLINSTADPSGERREYVLRVPGRMNTAIEARNWTCGIEAGERFDVVS